MRTLNTLGWLIALCSMHYDLRSQNQETSSGAETVTGIDIITREEDLAALSGETATNEEKPFTDLDGLEVQTLRRMEFLNESDIARITDYLRHHGPLMSVLELQGIDGMDPEKVRKMIPLIRPASAVSSYAWKSWSALKEDFNGRISFRWSEKFQAGGAGETADKYDGSPDRAFMRARFNLRNKLQFGVIAEKDEGEKWWSARSPTGVDYLSAFMLADHIHPRITRLIIGDYRLRTGQGLLLDNGFSPATFQDPGFLVKSPMMLKPYTSLRENNMLRGASAVIRCSAGLDAQLFFSSKRTDASVTESAPPGAVDSYLLSARQTTGYHRTDTEQDGRNRLRETVAGVQIMQNLKCGHAGASIIHYSEKPGWAAPSAPYQIFEHAPGHWMGSVFHQTTYRGTLAFGELAAMESGLFGATEGVLRGLGKYADAALSWRYFSPGFGTPYSQSFTFSGWPRNETGWLAVLNFFADKEWQMHLGWNSGRHSWLRYKADLPSASRECSFNLVWKRKRKWTLYLRYAFSGQMQNTQEGRETGLSEFTSKRLRLHAEVRIHPDLTWRARAEYHRSEFGSKKESGWLLFQDFMYKPVESRFSGNCRSGIVRTDSYESRIYAYENDLLYQFGIPAYFGKRIFAYVNLRYRMDRRWLVECRWSSSRDLSPGPSESTSAKAFSEFKMQLHFDLN